MANQLVTGTVVVKVQQKSVRSMPGAKLNFGGFSRKAIVADGRVIGPSQTPVPSDITFTFAHTSAADIDAVNNMFDETVQFECDSGPVYTIPGCFSVDPPELTGDGGGVSCHLQGQPAVQTS